MYELFEHTADLGLRVRAEDLNTLFAEAAACLFSAIVEDLGTVRTARPVTIELSGPDREFLLFDWLNQLLYHFDADHLVFSAFEVRVSVRGLAGVRWGGPA